jgi:hypothetical protein
MVDRHLFGGLCHSPCHSSASTLSRSSIVLRNRIRAPRLQSGPESPQGFFHLAAWPASRMVFGYLPSSQILNEPKPLCQSPVRGIDVRGTHHGSGTSSRVARSTRPQAAQTALGPATSPVQRPAVHRFVVRRPAGRQPLAYSSGGWPFALRDGPTIRPHRSQIRFSPRF